jgi:serine protease Do
VTSLPTNAQFRIDTPVISVGNALGQGIVARDGTLTSETPEEQDGAWQWLRFSAPASPGNSGGPLLDASGRVIGVIARKSANENLNYALPIELVLNAPANRASIDMRITAGVPFLTARKSVRVRTGFDLPLPFAQFDRKLIELNDEQFDAARRQLLAESADQIYPRGNSSRLLADTFLTANPAIISQQADGSWDVPRNNAGGTTQLGNDGYIWMGSQPGVALFRIRYPGELDVVRARGDSKLLSEQLLRGIRLGRGFGAENVRITSLGDAGKPREFKDDFGRTWQQWFYPMPFADSTMVVSALPVPEGYIGMWRSTGGAGVERTALELRQLANFTQVSYSGSLPQWRSFLADTALRPASFGEWKAALDPAGEISLGFPRFSLQVNKQVLDLTNDSQLNVFPGILMDGDTPAWDVLAVQLNLESRRSAGIGTLRRAKPAADAGQVPTNRWADMQQERGPFSGSPIRNQGGGVGRKVVGAEGKSLAQAEFLYEVSYATTTQVQGEIQRALPQLLEMVRIIEK